MSRIPFNSMTDNSPIARETERLSDMSIFNTSRNTKSLPSPRELDALPTIPSQNERASDRKDNSLAIVAHSFTKFSCMGTPPRLNNPPTPYTTPHFALSPSTTNKLPRARVEGGSCSLYRRFVSACASPGDASMRLAPVDFRSDELSGSAIGEDAHPQQARSSPRAEDQYLSYTEASSPSTQRCSHHVSSHGRYRFSINRDRDGRKSLNFHSDRHSIDLLNGKNVENVRPVEELPWNTPLQSFENLTSHVPVAPATKIPDLLALPFGDYELIFEQTSPSSPNAVLSEEFDILGLGSTAETEPSRRSTLLKEKWVIEQDPPTALPVVAVEVEEDDENNYAADCTHLSDVSEHTLSSFETANEASASSDDDKTVIRPPPPGNKAAELRYKQRIMIRELEMLQKELASIGTTAAPRAASPDSKKKAGDEAKADEDGPNGLKKTTAEETAGKDSDEEGSDKESDSIVASDSNQQSSVVSEENTIDPSANACAPPRKTRSGSLGAGAVSASNGNYHATKPLKKKKTNALAEKDALARAKFREGEVFLARIDGSDCEGTIASVNYCPKKSAVLYRAQYECGPAEDPIPEEDIEEADLDFYVACVPIKTSQRGPDQFRLEQQVFVKSGQDYKTDWIASVIGFIGDKWVSVRYDSGTEENAHVARITPIEECQRRRRRSNSALRS